MSKVACPYRRASKSTNQQNMDLGKSESKLHRAWHLGTVTTVCHTDVTNNKKELLGRQNTDRTVSFPSKGVRFTQSSLPKGFPSLLKGVLQNHYIPAGP